MRNPRKVTLPTPMEFTGQTTVRISGREFIFFGGCDYFRMSSHPTVIRTASRALEKLPLSVAASRRTTGNHPLIEKLEADLAQFFRAPTALVVASGYVTNLIVAQALASRFADVLLDDKAHGSLVDAAAFLGGRVHHFPHRGVPALRQLLHKRRLKRPVILLTDGLCAHNGQVAPLREYQKSLPPGSWMIVDDAHGAGVVGKHGRGSLEFAGIKRERVIQTTTLSKAFGCHGGVILCDRATREAIISSSRMFIGSTPPALPLIAAATASLKWLKAHPQLRERAGLNAGKIRSTLRRCGFPVEPAPAPIIAFTTPTPQRADVLEKVLRTHGILPPRLRYPGSPEGGYFRFVISSAHRTNQIRILNLALETWLCGEIC